MTIKKHLSAGGNLGSYSVCDHLRPPSPPWVTSGESSCEQAEFFYWCPSSSHPAPPQPLGSAGKFVSALRMCKSTAVAAEWRANMIRTPIYGILKENDNSGRLALSKAHHTGDVQEFKLQSLLFFQEFSFFFSTCEMALKEAQLEMHILYFLIRVWLSPPSPPYCFKLSPKQNAKPPVFQGVQHLAE